MIQKDLSEWIDIKRIELSQKISEYISKPYTIEY